MNKIKMIIFLLLTLFCSYSVAEESYETKPHVKSSIFNVYLAVKEIQEEGLVLVLNDGSEWDIKYFGGGWKLFGWGWTEQKEISQWIVGDNIEIQYPGSGNFTDFVLLVTNLSKKEKAWITLKKSPSVDDSACLYVVDFDKETNRMTLNNGTVWFKTTVDMYGAFFLHEATSQRSWKVGDALTLIRGEGWFNENSFFLWNHSNNEMPFVNRLD